MTQQSLQLLVAAFLLPLAYWFLGCILKAYQPALRRIPGPWLARFTPLWRLYFVHDGNAHDSYRKLHEEYGAIVRTAPNVVDISDPSAVTTIYSINSKYQKSPFYHTFTSVYENEAMDNMFSTADPEEHKRLKRSVSQKYSMTSIRTMEYLVDPCSKIFTDAMTDLQGQTVDLGTWVQWYAFDVIGAISFSRRYGFMEERRDVHDVIAGIETGLMYGTLVGQLPWLHQFLLGSAFFRKVLKKLSGGRDDVVTLVTKMVLKSIEEYDTETADGSGRGDFLAYLQQQKAKHGDGMSNRDIVSHLMTNLLAGSDTTAISLRAVFYYLMQNKKAYQTLQEEIDAAGDKLSPIITYAESLQLEYLQACIKEAMRMHPGVAFPLERIVPPGGTQLCGMQIPADTIVGVNAAVIHRNVDIFGADANEFRPERWLDEDGERIKTMDRFLLTFGAGTRSCIGKNISIMEMGKLVPQLLRDFDLEWAAEEPTWRVNTYWFAKQSGLLVRMKPRKK